VQQGKTVGLVGDLCYKISSMTIAPALDPHHEAARIRAGMKARLEAEAPDNRALALGEMLAETSATPEGVAILQALVLQMDEVQSQLEESVERMTVLVATKEVLIGKLVQAVKDLKALKFGKRSEKLSPDQLALALEDVVLSVCPKSY
jgi:hypothetical protein